MKYEYISPKLNARQIRLVLIGLAAFLFVLVIWLIFGGSDPIDVVVRPVDKGKVEATVTNTRAGLVEACQRAKLSTIVGGRIDYIGAREGDRVKQGQVLMKLWQGDLLASIRVTEAQVGTAQQRKREICTRADQAVREAVRQEELVKKGFVTANAAEKYRAEAESLKAACSSSGAEVETVERQLESLHTDLNRTVITAPFDGAVAKINGEVGEITTPSPTGIAMPTAVDLIDDSCLYVKAPMDEIDAHKIEIGQPVRVKVEAIKDATYEGKVWRISPYISAEEKQARTVDIDVSLDMEKAKRLLVGYSADIEIILSAQNNALRVPTAALRDGRRVWVVQKGVVVERSIEPGLANMEQTQVKSGLNVGDLVITSLAVPGLGPGVKVRAKSAAPQNP